MAPIGGSQGFWRMHTIDNSDDWLARINCRPLTDRRCKVTAHGSELRIENTSGPKEIVERSIAERFFANFAITRIQRMVTVFLALQGLMVSVVSVSNSQDQRPERLTTTVIVASDRNKQSKPMNLSRSRPESLRSCCFDVRTVLSKEPALATLSRSLWQRRFVIQHTRRDALQRTLAEDGKCKHISSEKNHLGRREMVSARL